MIYVKTYPTDNGYIVAMCDKDLLGKTLSEGKIHLELARYASFYKGDLVSADDAKREMGKIKRLYTANIVGKDAVGVFIELGLAEKGDVKMVSGVPFLQVYQMD